MVRFINQHWEVYRVESMCAALPIAPSTYFLRTRWSRTPESLSARAHRDDELRVDVQRVWDANEQVYGPRKVWKQLRREKCGVARCRVARLMRAMGVRGAGRGSA